MRLFAQGDTEVPFEMPDRARVLLLVPSSGNILWGDRNGVPSAILQFKDSESDVMIEVHIPKKIAEEIGAELTKKKLIVVGGE